METIDLNTLHQLMSSPVEVSIQDIEGSDRAPFIRKDITKIELCPDKTHVRIFFDEQKFFAIPLLSKVEMVGSDWTATDMASKLTYVIRRVSEI